MAHFEIKDLSFYYPTEKKKPSLSHINLKIERGQYVTVCGKSGSGKTTLLRHLKSVLAPHGKTEGEIFFEGKPLKDADLRTQSSRIGYVMQNPDNQIVTDKVWHELAFGLESLGMDQKTIRLRVAEMASYFGIQGWFHKNVTELSGGQKQLLNLASIMAMQPSILILDEPTSQLDPIAATDFLNTVRKINRELRTTIIITEHRLEDIFYASDKVVVVEDGKIIADDEPRKIGDFLKNGNNDMFAAMPTPVQIYYGVKKFQEEKNLKPEKETIKCPLTVREGGDWLSHMFEEKTPAVTRIEEKITTDPDEVKDPAVLVKEVWFRYEKDTPDVLKGITFQVPQNSLFAIVGGNGAGKSTTLKAISNICKPYRGKVLIQGKPVKKYKSGELFDHLLAMLPQDPQSLFVKKTVREDLEEMLRGKDEEKKSRIEKVAETCHISHLLEHHPYDLSGGEQQRAAIGKVLLLEPRLLLLDEPTKGIDAWSKRQLGNLLKDLRGQGITVLMATHDVEFAAEVSDRCGLFFDHEITSVDTPEEFFCNNNYYTTAANRISRQQYENAITCEEVIELCRQNGRKSIR
mgnify:CR=1 FL=1